MRCNCSVKLKSNNVATKIINIYICIYIYIIIYILFVRVG